MDREPVLHSQSEPGEHANGTAPRTAADASAPTTPNPPRLTPNPMLLDSLAPVMTPATSSPPPPLTPAPSVSATHVPRVAAAGGAPSPHLLVPPPPKLTSTAVPALRTYSRPILPSPSGASKTSPPKHRPPAPLLPAASSTPPVAPSSTLALPPSSSSSPATHSSSISMSSKTSTGQTNGNARPVSTVTTSTPITPFHTPASPGRQVSQPHPVGTPGLVRANQSASPVRQRVSQQTLLLGKGLKGSGPDQVLLRAQMLILTSAMRPSLSSSSSSCSPPSSNHAYAKLQSLTLRPPPHGALTIPPSLRLKPPCSAPPPLSRPHGPLFPPLRPRPLSCAAATERPTAPGRHLSVPPPTLYSPVRVVPLRPRLHPANGHRAAAPRQTASLQPIGAAPPACRAPLPVSRPLTQALRGPPSVSAAARFERSPSAARQLQIIALSSGRQNAPPEPPGPLKRTWSGEAPPLPPDPSLPKNSSSCLPSPPSLLSAPPPPSQPGPQAPPASPRGEGKAGEEQRERGRGVRQGVRGEASASKDPKGETEGKEERPREGGLAARKEAETAGEEEQMEVTEEGRSDGEEKKMEQEGGEAAMDQSEIHQKMEPVHTPDAVKDSKPPTGLVKAPVQAVPVPVPVPVPIPVSAPVPATVPAPVPVTVPAPEVSVQSRSHQDLQPVSQEDFCENMSTQSDNQSALSSLSSQSPPPSPFAPPSTDISPPLPPQTAVSLSEKVGESARSAVEPLGQSGDESESVDRSPGGPWEPRAWPEGQQVNRSSLLVQKPGSQPEEVNVTNGSAASPVADAADATNAAGQAVPRSSESEGEAAGDADDLVDRTTHRDRTVLHCQFCGKRGHAHNFMRSKRFCSTSCARGFNVRLTKRLRALSAGSRSERPRPVLNRAESVPGKPLLLRLPRDLWSAGRREKEGKEKAAAEDEGEDEDEEEEDMEGERGEEEEEEDMEEDPAVAMTARMERRAARRARRASAPTLTSSAPTSTFQPAPSQWSVEDVTAFIHTLPGCGDVAEAFRLQEIDGQALLLLTEDHLMTSMNIKLGPALKICAHINALRNQ
ncbi:polyhomeotic-like protein 3 isoform X2 [Pungitius pungitius]|uniref:polyhomeotic-like protein 3 isoform X2 n=1 Tax=Pungitius pungitius TaxID=134920 RepID=UPI002E0DA2B3